jgi:NADH-quinone oxidoreductase subunit N
MAPSVEWWSLTPILSLLGGGLLLLIVGSLTPAWPRNLYALWTAATAGVATVFTLILWDNVSDNGTATLVKGALAFDHLALFGTLTVVVSVGLVALLTSGYLRREQMDGPEVYALYLMAAIGAIVMLSANDLVLQFLGLETLSIALYVLAASHRRRVESQESGLKYFILGGFASAILLYGVALVYGATGSTNISDIARVLRDEVQPEGSNTMLLVGLGLLLVGLAFKVAAAPFQFWAPDVYQGAPTPVTAFMASAAKVAAFVALIRVLLGALPARADDWRPAIWAIAVLSLAVGAIAATVQSDVKRMLAYSSVNHAGFILIGIEAAGHVGNADSRDGIPSATLYLLLYSVLVIGSFGVVALVSRRGDGSTDLASFRGLSRQKPLLALAMTVFLVAQAGVPLTSGFVAKFGVIRSGVNVHSYALGIIAMLSAVIAAFLYLRIMISMWAAPAEAGDEDREPVTIPVLGGAAIYAAALFTLVVGFAPGWFIDISERVTQLAG